jgi:hypothetical protein
MLRPLLLLLSERKKRREITLVRFGIVRGVLWIEFSVPIEGGQVKWRATMWECPAVGPGKRKKKECSR